MIKKTVTPRKRAANQENAKRSTGPRTEWGKFNSRFNAVKSGLFAEEVVIPDCDGDNASQSFSELLLDLQHDFEPIGRFENVLVEKVAEALWRQRRAIRAEHGATRVKGFWDKSYEFPEDSFADRLNRSVAFERLYLQLLNKAREEIRRTGELSAESYEKIRPLVEDHPCDSPCDKNSDTTSEPVIGKNSDTTSEPVIDDDFVERIERKIELLQFAVFQVDSRLADRIVDSVKQGALPPADEIEKISRYRMRTEKEIEWALKTLSSHRKNRRQRKQRR